MSAHIDIEPGVPEACSDALRSWLQRHRRIFVLTGAGVSTGAGIPDYRDRSGEWKRTPPITLQALTGSAATYRRYWARSFAGWPRFASAQPAASHLALAALEREGVIWLLVTQNVDRLHQRAGSGHVLDLHGRLDSVVCLTCGNRVGREALQLTIRSQNLGWSAGPAGTAPDGDADIPDPVVETFDPPRCGLCNGLLKPDVVFFGENVPIDRVRHARQALAGSDAMLVVGSSLMVWSGYRFAQAASKAGLPLAILNQGRTRADDLATLKVDADCGTTLIDALP